MPALLDAVDHILLSEAELAVATSGPTGAAAIAVIGDETGALTRAVVEAGKSPDVRVHCDSFAAQRRVISELGDAGVEAYVAGSLEDAVRGADLVLLRLPKSLAALAEVGNSAARLAAPSLQLLGGARVKHLSRGMNGVLLASFAEVRASLGQRKSRVLIASGPRGGTPAPAMAQERHDALGVGVTICAAGGVFAGSSIDLGSRFLLSFADRFLPPTSVVDLGSGNGILGVVAALTHPGAQVLGVDDSQAAIRSTLATAAVNGVADRVRTLHADRLERPPGSADLVLCNPPFHRGTAEDSTTALTMFSDAARVLRPGGELWVVFNSHLPYLPELRRRVGSTVVAGQNRSFTVTRSTRAAARS